MKAYLRTYVGMYGYVHMYLNIQCTNELSMNYIKGMPPRKYVNTYTYLRMNSCIYCYNCPNYIIEHLKHSIPFLIAILVFPLWFSRNLPTSVQLLVFFFVVCFFRLKFNNITVYCLRVVAGCCFFFLQKILLSFY